MGRGKEKHTCFYFLVVLIQIFDTVLSCPASMPTVSYVSYCPTTHEEWEKAAERKNCDSIAAIQNCTNRSRFKYHCLMNHWKNATLEVCAPIFYLQGYCAEYNIEMKQVAEIYDEGFECLKFNGTHKCPRRYPSNEAYKYQRCYRYKNILMDSEEISSKDKDNSWIALVFIVIASLLFAILVFVLVMMKKGICKKLKGCKQTNKNLEQNKNAEEETDLLTVDRNDKPRPSSKSKHAPEPPKTASIKSYETKLSEQEPKAAKDKKIPPPRPLKGPAND